MTFYGAAFGIFSSFIVYKAEKKKEKRLHEREIKPIFSVEVTRRNENNEIFDIAVDKLNEKPITNLCLYDLYISPLAKNHYDFVVSYLSEEKEKNEFLNVTIDDDIIDKDGYPKFVQILCDDVDNAMWSLVYYKADVGNKKIYVLRETERY